MVKSNYDEVQLTETIVICYLVLIGMDHKSSQIYKHVKRKKIHLTT